MFAGINTPLPFTLDASVAWWNSTWRYRAPIQFTFVSAAGESVQDWVTWRTVSFQPLLAAEGETGAFDPDSVRMVEYDSQNRTILGGAGGEAAVVPCVLRAAPPNTNPTPDTFELVWRLPGITAANATRLFHVYFDTVSRAVGRVSATAYPPSSTRAEFNASTSSRPGFALDNSLIRFQRSMRNTGWCRAPRLSSLHPPAIYHLLDWSVVGVLYGSGGLDPTHVSLVWKATGEAVVTGMQMQVTRTNGSASFTETDVGAAAAVNVTVQSGPLYSEVTLRTPLAPLRYSANTSYLYERYRVYDNHGHIEMEVPLHRFSRSLARPALCSCALPFVHVPAVVGPSAGLDSVGRVLPTRALLFGAVRHVRWRQSGCGAEHPHYPGVDHIRRHHPLHHRLPP